MEEFAKRDNTIEQLEHKLNRQVKVNRKLHSLKLVPKPQTSNISNFYKMHATEGKSHGNVTKSRDFIISMLPGIPSYTDETCKMFDAVQSVGKGQFVK